MGTVAVSAEPVRGSQPGYSVQPVISMCVPSGNAPWLGAGTWRGQLESTTELKEGRGWPMRGLGGVGNGVVASLKKAIFVVGQGM